MCDCPPGSPPARGARIETAASPGRALPPRGRLPHGGRGLKHLGRYRNGEQRKVASRTGGAD